MEKKLKYMTKEELNKEKKEIYYIELPKKHNNGNWVETEVHIITKEDEKCIEFKKNIFERLILTESELKCCLELLKSKINEENK